MQSDSKIYYRESLKEICYSYQIAYSYLEGRVDKEEIFSIDGRKLVIEQILVQDEVVRDIVRKNGDCKKWYPEQCKLDSFGERCKLFYKIVLRGDDSLSSFMLDVENKKDQIAYLQAVCQNVIRALRLSGTVVNHRGTKAELTGGTIDIFSILHDFTEKLCTKMQKKIVVSAVKDMSAEYLDNEYIQEVNDFRGQLESLVAKQEEEKQQARRLQEELSQKVNEAVKAKEVALQKLKKSTKEKDEIERQMQRMRDEIITNNEIVKTQEVRNNELKDRNKASSEQCEVLKNEIAKLKEELAKVKTENATPQQAAEVDNAKIQTLLGQVAEKVQDGNFKMPPKLHIAKDRLKGCGETFAIKDADLKHPGIKVEAAAKGNDMPTLLEKNKALECKIAELTQQIQQTPKSQLKEVCKRIQAQFNIMMCQFRELPPQTTRDQLFNIIEEHYFMLHAAMTELGCIG